MNNIIKDAFKHKNGATWYIHIKVGRNKSYFTNDPLNGDNKYTASGICKMIEFWWITYMLGLVDSLFDRQLGRNCAPLLADLFLYSYENEVLDKFIKEDKRKLARKFSLSYCYTDDLLSMMKDLMNSSLISTQKNSPFLRLQNLLQLLLISTSFLLEIRTTTLPPN